MNQLNGIEIEFRIFVTPITNTYATVMCHIAARLRLCAYFSSMNFDDDNELFSIQLNFILSSQIFLKFHFDFKLQF